MRIVFVLTYPAYYSMPDLAEWLRWDNRDRRMPAIAAELGADTELWAIGREAATIVSDESFGAPYPIRLFAADNPRANGRRHRSRALIDAACADAADLFVLIGVDGGAGLSLYDAVLKPARRPFAVIIGGGYWSRLVPHAALVLTETERQEEALARPPFWRRTVKRERMRRLPKTIDTDRFAPQDVPVRRDVVAVSRLTPVKSFAEVGALSADHRVAVAGDGPLAARLRRDYSQVEWLGHVPNRDVPALLSSARLYFHAGRREFFPRAIPEAMACGRAVVGFADVFGDDVIPPDCGLRVTDADYRRQVAALLADPARLAAMGAAARAHAVAHHGPRSSEPAVRALMALAGSGAA